ncbi:MAG: hypothetical protein HZB79_07060 [Deltaproteobacteria bacterium]|nr:hypothetical protein [Deltaproteobacteria bacterium]
MKELLVHIVYLQNYFSPSLNHGIYWSLAVEEQFYILIPFVLYLFIKYKRKHLFTGLIILILLAVSIRFILYDASKDWDSSFLRPFHIRFDNLLFGVLAALLFISYKDKLEALSYKWKILILLIPLVSLGLSFLYGSLKTSYFNVCWQFTLTSLGFSTIIFYVILFPFSSYTPPHSRSSSD